MVRCRYEIRALFSVSLQTHRTREINFEVDRARERGRWASCVEHETSNESKQMKGNAPLYASNSCITHRWFKPYGSKECKKKLLLRGDFWLKRGKVIEFLSNQPHNILQISIWTKKMIELNTQQCEDYWSLPLYIDFILFCSAYKKHFSHFNCGNYQNCIFSLITHFTFPLITVNIVAYVKKWTKKKDKKEKPKSLNYQQIFWVRNSDTFSTRRKNYC